MLLVVVFNYKHQRHVYELNLKTSWIVQSDLLLANRRWLEEDQEPNDPSKRASEVFCWCERSCRKDNISEAPHQLGLLPVEEPLDGSHSSVKVEGRPFKQHLRTMRAWGKRFSLMRQRLKYLVRLQVMSLLLFTWLVGSLRWSIPAAASCSEVPFRSRKINAGAASVQVFD